MKWLWYIVGMAALLLVAAPGASAATETFGPSLAGAQISGLGAFSGHAVSEEEEAWYAGTAPLVGGAPPSAPISGSISKVQLEYSSMVPMEVEVWTAKGANEEWAMDRPVGAMELPSTEMNPMIATLEPSGAQITQGEILAVLNSGPSGHIYPYLENSEGCVGNFEETAPQPGSLPKPIHPGQPAWACKNLDPGLLIDGTVTSEATTGGSSGTGGSSPPPSAELTGKVFLTKTPNAINAPEKCYGPSIGPSIVNLCEGGVTFGPLQSVFSTVSDAGASAKPKHAPAYGHATFKIPAGQTQDVRIPLTRKARKLLLAKGKLRGKAITVLILPDGEKATTTRVIMVKLSRSRHRG